MEHAPLERGKISFLFLCLGQLMAQNQDKYVNIKLLISLITFTENTQPGMIEFYSLGSVLPIHLISHCLTLPLPAFLPLSSEYVCLEWYNLCLINAVVVSRICCFEISFVRLN